MSLRIIAQAVLRNPGNRGQMGRRIAAAIQWQILKRTTRRPKRLRLANGTLFRAYPDCVVSSALIYAGFPEYSEIMFLRANLHKDEVLLDVGANVGHFSLLLSDVVKVENIHAFEPTPVTFQRLCENWELNTWHLEGLHASAVGRSNGRIAIPNTVRPITTNAVQQKESRDTTTVPLVALDSCLSWWHGRHVGLLKIDVEGYEAEVFAGASELIARDRPTLIMFESLAGRVDPDILRVLKQARYLLFQLDHKGRPDFARQSKQNLFAVPEERAHHLK